MSKYRDIIEEEPTFLYKLYTTEAEHNERKKYLGMYFMISYQLRERCTGKNDYEIVIELLRLRNEVEEELEYRIKHTGENSDAVKSTRYKLKELDRIEYFFLTRA